jgi:hypothetical protein
MRFTSTDSLIGTLCEKVQGLYLKLFLNSVAYQKTFPRKGSNKCSKPFILQILIFIELSIA